MERNYWKQLMLKSHKLVITNMHVPGFNGLEALGKRFGDKVIMLTVDALRTVQAI